MVGAANAATGDEEPWDEWTEDEDEDEDWADEDEQAEGTDAQEGAAVAAAAGAGAVESGVVLMTAWRHVHPKSCPHARVAAGLQLLG